MTTTLTIDLDAIAANWRTLEARHGAPTAAVVKADGYGLGAPAVAQRLAQEGVSDFFVAWPEEGAALRAVLPATARIVILNGLFGERPGLYVAQGLTPVLGSLGEIEAWAAHARHVGRALPALIHIDTGMNRLGLPPAEVERLAHEPGRLDAIALRYRMTHLSNAELADDPRNTEQVRRLRAACARLPPAPLSIANSSGIFLGDAFRSGLARPGAALYGINPTPSAPNPMQPVLRLSGLVLQLRDVPAGEAVGYNGIWTAPRPTRVATVSIGYADGYHRALSGRAQAAFDGARIPLIGRVSMDLATFDVTGQKAIVPGSKLELIGPAVPPDEVASWAGTNGYEILTSLGGTRAPRTYGPL